MSGLIQPQEAMRRAIALSRRALATESGPPFGAVIVRNGEIIGEGSNHVHVNNDPTAHAEIMAIRHACATLKTPYLDGAILFSSSEPCPMCMSAIYWSRIAAVHFSTDRHAAAQAGFDDLALYKELERPCNKRRISMTQTIPEEGQVTFEIWKNDCRAAIQTQLNEDDGTM